MPSKQHWENVYATKAATAVSWFQAHADLSLRLIAETGASTDASIIDVGPATDLFAAKSLVTTFSAILPTAVTTPSAVINFGNVFTNVDVGLIAPPVLLEAGLSPVAPNPSQPESTDRTSLIANDDDPEPSALDELFGSIVGTAGDLSLW